MEFVCRKVHFLQFFIHHSETFIAFRFWYHWYVDAVQVALWGTFCIFLWLRCLSNRSCRWYKFAKYAIQLEGLRGLVRFWCFTSCSVAIQLDWFMDTFKINFAQLYFITNWNQNLYVTRRNDLWQLLNTSINIPQQTGACTYNKRCEDVSFWMTPFPRNLSKLFHLT